MADSPLKRMYTASNLKDRNCWLMELVLATVFALFSSHVLRRSVSVPLPPIGGSMQFGRLHAIALLVFGVFLLLAQAWISLASNDATPAAPPAAQSAPFQSSDRESIIHLL